MNWFERYGVVGAYFWIAIFLWFKSISNFTMTTPKIALAALAMLPLGYILTVLSQTFYYSYLAKNSFMKLIFGKQIHKEIVKSMDRDYKTKFGLSNCTDEHICETKMTSFLRLESFKKEDLKALEYLATFITRRWDVLAINRSIILSTILSPILCIGSIWLHPNVSFYKVNCRLYVFIMILLFLVVWGILRVSTKIMEEQILKVNEHIISYMKKNKL